MVAIENKEVASKKQEIFLENTFSPRASVKY